MKITRLGFLEALDVVKPALATKDLIEELTHVWFDGHHVMAYNDAELGIQIALQTPFKGGLRGGLLIGLLSNSRAREITIEDGESDDTMILRAARTKATLTMLEQDRTPWKFPKSNREHQFEFDDEFIEALKSVMISVGRNTAIPETLGVTFMVDGDMLRLFATDTDTIATTAIPLPDGFKTKRKTVPKAFCEELLRLYPDGGFLEFRSDCIIAENDESSIRVYARLIDVEKPQPLQEQLDAYAKWKTNARFDIPERLSLALDRMGVLFEGLVGESMSVSLVQGKMGLSADVAGRGQLKDSVVIPGDVPELSFRVNPAFLKRAIDGCAKMVCFEDAVRLSKGHFVYLVANSVD